MKTKILATFILVLLIILLVKMFIQPDSQPTSVLGEKEALDAILVQYPQLAVYQTTDLPPSSIESKQSRDGWYFGFIQRGSGVPGILDAKCYYLKNDRTITLLGEYKRGNSSAVDFIDLETCESAEEIPQIPSVSPDTDTGLRLGELGTFTSISILPLSIEEDSRCPVDVTCIQAGTVRLKIQVVSRTGTSTSIVELGQEFTTEGMSITLTNVTPPKNSKIDVEETEYRFNFNVVKQDAPIVTNPSDTCYRGGCSSQLCSDQPDMASTCEFREEYACYQSAVCERQASGQCGWTETADLRACLGTQSR
ncbi:hypothetical protein IPH92_02940 [Candidatus Kaiserbacteria bacterium]|nr:MAG: hypothetical protein IPH92_02940 [Candidatus Kaiserbacteria bacterium]